MKKLVVMALSMLLLCLAACSGLPQPKTELTDPSALPDGTAETFIAEGRTIYSDNAVVEYNSLAYFAANNNIYSFDGKTCKAEMSGDHNSPFSFYIDDGKLLYMTQYQSTIFMRDMNHLSDTSAEKAYGNLYMDEMQQHDFEKNKTINYSLFHYSTFLVAEGHVFYKGKDKKLHRATLNGKNDRKISDIDVENLTYSNGYIYFMEWKNESSILYRIKTDGTKQIKLPKQANDGFFISQQGNLYFERPDADSMEYTYLQVDDNGIVIKNLGTFHYDVINIDDNYIYFYYCSDDGNKCALLRKPLDGTDMEPIYQPSGFIQEHDYPPVLVGDYIYFFMDSIFYRIKKDGTGLTEIGTERTSVNPRV